MITIVNSVLGSTRCEDFDLVSSILEEKDILSKDIQNVFSFLTDTYKITGSMPTYEIFINKYPNYKIQIDSSPKYSGESLNQYKKQFMNKMRNLSMSRIAMDIANRIATNGYDPSMLEDLRKYQPTVDTSNEDENLTQRELYTKRMNVNTGYKFGVPEIDDKAYFSKGQVAILCAYTGSFKTTMAVNMAYNNAKLGHHVVYISLEVSKVDLLYDLWSLHSTDPKFRMSIEHDSIRRNKLDKKALDYLFDEIVPDFEREIAPKFTILDETEIGDFSEGTIRDFLTEIDIKNPIDIVFYDHANLFKFYTKQKFANVGDSINQYVSFIRRISIAFRKDSDTGENKQLASVLLVQANREGWRQASKPRGASGQILRSNSSESNDEQYSSRVGYYTLTALSEANELERCASIVISIFTNDKLKLAGEAKLMILKSRYGQTDTDPVTTNVDYPHYKFGGGAGFNAGATLDMASFDDFYSGGGLFDTDNSVKPTKSMDELESNNGSIDDLTEF